MKRLGQLLSAMVYRNIAVIIAVGIIQGIFGVYGWWYNDTILLLVNPINNILLPILLGYTGGMLIGGKRGAVVAAVVTYGLILSTSTPTILGAMIIGPFTGWVVKKLDEAIKKMRHGAGYELLIENVIAAAVAAILTIVCFLYLGQAFTLAMDGLTILLEKVVNSNWLPMAAVIIEPAKVLFLNNIVNFGILGPLGFQQAKDVGKSIFFLLESNPGPGLGVLLAYWLKSKAEKRNEAKLAVFIHFIGGIHEVCFPYVLMKPFLIVSLILGGMAGHYVFQLFDVGLVAIPSPGSILLFIGLAPKEDLLFILLGVSLSAIVSFLCSMLLLKPITDSIKILEGQENTAVFSFKKNEPYLNKAAGDTYIATSNDHGNPEENQMETFSNVNKVRNILFICEAGMGSSAMGAAMLKKKLEQAKLSVEVGNSSISEIPETADFIVCHQKFLSVVQKAVPDKPCYPLKSFTDMKGYNDLVEQINKLL